MKKIVLATGSLKLDQIFKTVLGSEEWTFNKHYIDERKYVIDTIKNESPDLLIIHEKLKSHHEKETDRDKEVINLIKHIRLDFSNIRVVFLGNRNPKDKMLLNLINLGVYDIFLNDFDGDEFKQRLNDPPVLQNVLAILNEHEDDEPTTLFKTNEMTEEDVSSSSSSDKEKDSSEKKHNVIPVFDDDLFDIAPPESQKEIVLMDRIIGSIFISVLGVQSNTGTTHTSILIANFLARKGVRVAIVEANASYDFASIEYAYEGGNGYLSQESMFEIQGVSYYKSSDHLYVHELIGQYDFIILDLGSYEKTKWLEEFFRSHIQVVVAAGSEWKRSGLLQFQKAYSAHDQERWLYAIPFAESLSLRDIQKELHHDQVFSVPVHSDPYVTQKDTDSLFDIMLKSFLPAARPKKQVSTYILIGSSLLVTILIIVMAFVLFS